MIRLFLRSLIYLVFIGAVVYGWITQKLLRPTYITPEPETLDSDTLDTPALVAHLDNSEWQTRLAAVKALGERRDPAALDGLLYALSDDDTDVREAAWQALALLGSAAVPALTEKLTSSVMLTREAAAKALEKIGDVYALPALIAALDDESAWVRLPVVRALGVVGDARVVNSLIARLLDSDADVRLAAAASLRHIGTPDALVAVKDL
ncbi:MAG: HEAT repeat domain-containing protein [bacterium]|nr:HEAT repeat domain-containing protein [bacterium]